MVSESKIQQVQQLVELLRQAKAVALVDYQGLSAEQIDQWRSAVRASGGRVQVVKNSLLQRALAQLGLTLDQPLKGPTAVIWALEDEVAPLKATWEKGKEWEKPIFKLGVVGERILDDKAIVHLAKLPPLPQLQAQFLGVLQANLARLASTLQAPTLKLTLLLKQLGKEVKENGGKE